MKVNEKRLTLTIDSALHKRIKELALSRNLTMKGWVLELIAKHFVELHNEHKTPEPKS